MQPSSLPVGPRPARILLYSHDSYGLGHLRRSLTIASALTADLPEAHVLVVTGSPCATFFPCPPGVGVVKLPSVSKDEAGAYVPRTLNGSLDAVLNLRRRIFLETFRVFAPDVVLIDHQVVGLHGEAIAVLRECRNRGVRTILGVRDIIDAPDAVAREWSTPEARWALSQGYDRLCVYGTPDVYDQRAEYPIPPELAERLEFVGYVASPPGEYKRPAVPPLLPQLAVTMGGGQDGAERIGLLLDALAVRPVDFDTTIIAGPLLDERVFRRLKRRARTLGGVRVHRSYDDIPSLLQNSHAACAMAGYNTCVELLQAGVPTVLLPRTHPRREQEIRAERFERLGLARSLVHPTPGELRDAIEDALEHRVGRIAGPLPTAPPLDGRERMCGVVRALLDPLTRRAQLRSLVS